MEKDKKSTLFQFLPDELSILRGSVAMIPAIGGLLDHLCFDQLEAAKIKNLQQGFEFLAEKISVIDEIKIEKDWFKSEEAFSIIENIIRKIDMKGTQSNVNGSFLSPVLSTQDPVKQKDNNYFNLNNKSSKQTDSIRAAIKQTAGSLLKIFSELENKLTSKSIKISVNQILLKHACEAYLIDVKRYKNTNMLEMVAPHKRAAFLFKWLITMRPVSVLSCEEDLEVYLTLHINTYFSLMAVLTTLHVDINEFAHTQIMQQIIHTASYHAVTPESWMMTFYLLENKFPLS